jgi:hypothetical protein
MWRRRRQRNYSNHARQ